MRLTHAQRQAMKENMPRMKKFMPAHLITEMERHVENMGDIYPSEELISALQENLHERQNDYDMANRLVKNIEKDMRELRLVIEERTPPPVLATTQPTTLPQSPQLLPQTIWIASDDNWARYALVLLGVLAFFGIIFVIWLSLAIPLAGA